MPRESSRRKEKEKDSKSRKDPKEKTSKSRISKKAPKEEKKKSSKKASDSRKDKRNLASQSRSNSRGNSNSKKNPSDKSRRIPKPSTTKRSKSKKVPEVHSKWLKDLKMGPKYVDIEDLNLIQEEVADDYLFKSKLENFLVLAIREVIRGEYLPKNPFPRILRSLYQSLWFNISNADIKKRKNKYIKNFIEKNEYPYKITKVKDKIDVFGYNYIL